VRNWDQAPVATRLKVGFVVGPTGIGKTAMAIAIAQRLGAEIVNADSRQIFRGMDIGTAKPSPADRARVPHHLLDLREPDQPLDVAQFRVTAQAAIADIAARGKRVMVVGGSGFYLRVLRCGIFAGPGASAEIRAQLREIAAQMGVDYLYQELRKIDPAAAQRIEARDAYRITRALEVFRLTGIPISHHQEIHRRSARLYASLTIGLELPRARLYEAIDRRFDEMIANGLVDEVHGLVAAGYHPEAPPLSTIGYKHTAAYLRGEMTLPEAIALAKRDTRRLAKRQLTWFRRDREIEWVDAEHGCERAAGLLEEFFAENDVAASIRYKDTGH
jgi:tRNA dimethylallyltransferase